MKSFKLFILSLCVLSMGLCLAGTAFASMKPDDVFVVREQGWILKKSGGEAEGVSGGNADTGFWFYVVNPENNDAAKGLESGVLLYNQNAEKYSFLPLSQEEANYVEGAIFSPGGESVVLAIRMGRFGSLLWVYDIATFKKQNEFRGYSDIFFVDGVRFAFTLLDEKVQRPEEAGMWGTSASLYDPADSKGYVVLNGATAKESFIVMGLAGDDKLTVSVTSVKAEKDWKDTNKWEESEITIDLPSAG